MIKTIIFDFGDVFINLDKERAMKRLLFLFRTDSLLNKMIATNNLYEQGLISTTSFIEFYKNALPNISEAEIINTWNSVLKDFPTYRLEFLKTLSEEKKYRLILLCNTNELHMNWVKEHIHFYYDFKNCFNVFYLSYKIQLRKPSPEIFRFVLDKNNLLAKECLFVDDSKEHIMVASQLGINTWNLNPKTEDIVDIFDIKKELF